MERQEKISNEAPMTGRSLNTNKGQMSLVFLVLLAVGLIFYAITINWGQLTSNKIQVEMASASGAASMVSSMASYAQSIIEGSLDGGTRLCGFTEVMMTIITIIVLIIIIVVAYATVGQSLVESGFILGLVAGLACAVISLIIQIAYTQPETTNLWRKMQADNQTSEERIAEAGIQAALQIAGSDSETIKDQYDFDMDNDQSDKIGRFSYLYSMRLWTYANPRCQAFKEYQKVLKTLAEELGIGANGKVERAHRDDCGHAGCDTCCMYLSDKQRTAKQDRCPDCTTVYVKDVPDSCEDPMSYPYYPYSYDIAYAYKIKNDTSKALGFIGLDDGNSRNRKVSPNDTASYEITNEATIGSRLIGWDSEGAVFPLLWELYDTVMDVGLYSPVVTTTATTEGGGDTTTTTTADDYSYLFNNTGRGCHWCDLSLTGGACSGSASGLYWNDGQLGTTKYRFPATQFDVGVDQRWRCAGDYTCCTQIFHDSWVIDKVNRFDVVPAQPSSTTTTSQGCPGTWRPGSDLYCSSSPPYNGDCPSHIATSSGGDVTTFGSVDSCGAQSDPALQSQWRDDTLDNLSTSLRLLLSSTIGQTAEDFCALTDSTEWLEDGKPAAENLIAALKSAANTLNNIEQKVDLWIDTKHMAASAWCAPLTAAAQTNITTCATPCADTQTASEATCDTNFPSTPTAAECYTTETNCQAGCNSSFPNDQAGKSACYAACNDAYLDCVPDEAGKSSCYLAADRVYLTCYNACIVSNATATDDMPPEEATAIGYGTADVGSLDKIVNCMEYNLGDTSHNSYGKSNYTRFEECAWNCREVCTNQCWYDAEAEAAAKKDTCKGDCADTCEENCDDHASGAEEDACRAVCSTGADRVTWCSAPSGAAGDTNWQVFEYDNKDDCEDWMNNCDSDCENIQPDATACWRDHCICTDSNGDNKITVHGECNDEAFTMPHETCMSDLNGIDQKLCSNGNSAPDEGRMKCGVAGSPRMPRCEVDHSENYSVFFRREGCSNDFAVKERNCQGAAMFEPAKFEKRKDYLEKTRVAIENMDDKFKAQADIITAMIPSIQVAWNNVMRTPKDTSQVKVTYIWRSEIEGATTEAEKAEGTWHAIQAEADVPGRCASGITNNKCDEAFNEGKFPWIDTWTKNWGTERCYSLKAHNGNVGIRVKRWDGDSATVKFANNLPLWTFTYGGSKVSHGCDIGAAITSYPANKWSEWDTYSKSCQHLLSTLEVLLSSSPNVSSMCGRYGIANGAQDMSVSIGACR